MNRNTVIRRITGKKLGIVIGILLGLVLFIACGSGGDRQSNDIGVLDVGADDLQATLAFKTMEQNCFSCHSPKGGGPDARIAPPMAAVKQHYLDHHPDKEAFIQSMVDFLQHPSKEKSLMPGALAKFGLMPVMDFPEETVTAVATYIYDHPMEEPGWYKKHYKKEKARHGAQGQEDYASNPLEKGRSLAMQTKSVLGKNLMKALQSQGAPGAMSFCSTRAIQLTDSMSTALGHRIRRVSDRPRNPANLATEEELAIILSMKEELASGGKPNGLVSQTGNSHLGCYPIITNNMCLQCHGAPSAGISDETMKLLQDLYPEDSATGYRENELRGIWVVDLSAE